MDMPKVTIGFGAALVVLGLIGYFGSGAESVTALIPTFFGIILAVLGVVAQNESRRPHAMHAAAALAVLGLLGSFMGLFQLPALISGDTSVERPWAVAVQSVMAVVLAVFVALCVRSFMDARRSRTA
jgi:FtsH-binding integral membrane protein